MSDVPALVDHVARTVAPRASTDPVTKSDTAYKGAAISQELFSWRPAQMSADAAYLPEMESISGRIQDIERNDGWASGGMQRLVDNVIGSGLRLNAQPDYVALGLTQEWAIEFAAQAEAGFRTWTDHPNNYCDVRKRSGMGLRYALCYRHMIKGGESVVLPYWLPKRPWATSILVIDPARMSNPQDKEDSERLRGGVEMDRLGAPIAYHFRKRHPNDVGYEPGEFEWERVPAETRFGRRRVIHYYIEQHAGQTRGVSPIAPILQKFKMLSKWDESSLSMAIINAILAAWIQSPFDPELLGQALSTVGDYQGLRKEFHTQNNILLSGARMPRLFPGEEVKFMKSEFPNSDQSGFTTFALRNFASAMGLTYEQLSMDWSDTNYSSARAALNEIWKFLSSERDNFGAGMATQIYALWLEEAIDRGFITLPAGAPSFQEAKGAYCRAHWIGPARGYVDPEKERKATQLGLEMGELNLSDVLHGQGKTLEEQLAQRARERAAFEAAGLPIPWWMNGQKPGAGDSSDDESDESEDGAEDDSEAREDRNDDRENEPREEEQAA